MLKRTLQFALRNRMIALYEKETIVASVIHDGAQPAGEKLATNWRKTKTVRRN